MSLADSVQWFVMNYAQGMDVTSIAGLQTLVEDIRNLEQAQRVHEDALALACEELRQARAAARSGAETAVAAIERIQLMEDVMAKVRNYFGWPTTSSIRELRDAFDVYEAHVRRRV